MVPALCANTAAVLPPSYQRALRKQPAGLHVTALALVTTLQLLALCRLAVRLAHRRCPPPLPKGPGGKPRTYSEESLLLIALLRTLWRLSYRDMHDWLCAWPTLACGLPRDRAGHPQVPSPSQQCKRAAAASAPPTRCSSWSWYRRPSAAASPALAIAAATARRSSPGGGATPLLPAGTPPPTTRPPSCRASAPTPCRVVARGCRASSSSRRPTPTTPPAPSSCSPGRCGSTRCARGSSAWMPPTRGRP